MARPAIPAPTTGTNIPKCQNGAPDKKYMASEIVTSTTEVPKSGCKMTGPIIKPNKTKKLVNRFSSLLLNHAARYMISVSLASSAGCTVIKPRSTQREAPYARIPIPGKNTAARSANVLKSSGIAINCSCR